jgi:hypothetical protein
MARQDFRSRWWLEVTRRCERAIAWSGRASTAFARPAVLVAVFLVLVPVCIILIRPAVHASGTTWYVNSNAGNDSNGCLSTGTACKTIGGAISKASAGDTIDVAAGTYNEQVVVTSTLTLNGAQEGVDARTRSGLESIITNICGPVQIEADNVTVNGFTIEGATSTSSNCLFVGIWTNPGFSGTHGGTQILNNIIQNNIAGIELDNDGTYQTKVQYNLIQNNNNSGPGAGNGIETDFGLTGASIDSNEFGGQTNESVVVEATSGNFTISNNMLDAGIALFDSSTVSITGNTSFGETVEGATIDIAGGKLRRKHHGQRLAERLGSNRGRESVRGRHQQQRDGEFELHISQRDRRPRGRNGDLQRGNGDARRHQQLVGGRQRA